MPLKLVPPVPGKTNNYYVRGTHLRVSVYRSAQTPDRRLAQRVLDDIRREIEAGRFQKDTGPTFTEALQAWLDAGHDERFTLKLLDHFKETPLSEIDQLAIDRAAAKLYPKATPATRNRQVHTPMSSILKHAGVQTTLKRPKGHAGEQKTDFLEPEEAERLFAAADEIDAELGAFLRTLVFVGGRLSESLGIEVRHVSLEREEVYFPKTKNGKPRTAYMPPVVAQAIAPYLDRGREKVFRFQKNGYLYGLIRQAKTAAGLDWFTFHTSRHTYGTWLRLYAGLDTKGLLATGAWISEKSAMRYAHAKVSRESRLAVKLPGAKGTTKRTTRTRGKSVDPKSK